MYQAHEDTAPGRTAALKVLADRRRGPADRTRLLCEFDLARQLQHPHIIPVFEVGPDWLSMDYISGGRITDLPTVPNRLAALGQIADALDYAHERGIAHCDVKPSNILVSQSFYEHGAVLVDFGSALSIGGESGPSASHVAASLPYCPPELLTGKAPAGATDEYSLACTAVELITGRPPLTANTQIGLMAAQLHSPLLARRTESTGYQEHSIQS